MAISAKHWKRLSRLLLVGLLLAFPFVVMRVPLVRRALVDLVEFMREVPLLGVGLFLVIETIALLVTTPLWLMSGLAGYAYGFGWGLLLAWPGVTLCACIVFLVGRTFANKIFLARSAETHFWRAVDHAVRTSGFKITLLMRLAVTFPQNLATYMLSATSLKLRDFALGTFCGLFPATVVHAYIGSNVESAAALVSGEHSARGPLAWVTMVLGLALTLAAVFVASRYARRALDQALAEAARANH
ncbi:MAG: VTT domain-containing protein [Polyangiaceae bacterium]|nr:VTT domain-containing protein [Polyangiaceae bacterium]